MAEDPPSTAKTSSSSTTNGVHPLRRAFTADDSNNSSSSNNPLRHRPSQRTFPPAHTSDATPGAAAATAAAMRRRSSTLSSDYSFKDARRSFQDSTEDLLLPRPGLTSLRGQHEPSHNNSSPWHSAPLAFALLPALGGMLFTNGSSITTDIMLLGLAAIFLNWSVRLPWDWYHSAQAIRTAEEYNQETMVVDDDASDGEEDENALSFSQATLEEVPEEGEQPATQTQAAPRPVRRLPAHEAATGELYRHEVLALIACFLFPVLGAYMLHTIRSQLSRPSEGLVSDYNLTIFLLASELRPMSHLVKLIQARTLHLQRIVASNPYDNARGEGSTSREVQDLKRRLEDMETRSAIAEPVSSEPTLNGKQSAVLTTEVRRSLQPDLEALNRAVRRYEKRATLQVFQTESRLQDIESRLHDAISLAAAAANNSAKHRGLASVIIESAAKALVIPIQALGTLVSLPFRTMVYLMNFGRTRAVPQQPPERTRKPTNGKIPSSVRLANVQGRSFKKQ